MSVKKLDKKKVAEKLINEENDYINAFNIIPNLSDKIIDYIQSNYNIVDMIDKTIPELRKYHSNLPVSLFVMAGIQARMKQMFTISELPLAITSNEVINKLGINIEFDKEKNLLKEANIRKFISRYDDTLKDDKKIELDNYKFNNNFIKYFNSINDQLLNNSNINCTEHILDCSILDVNIDNSNYEYSTVTFKGGEHLRGYKLGLLRGITPFGGVLEEVCMSTAIRNDKENSSDMILNSKYLKEGDFLLEDRGFLDIENFRKLNEKGINIITPVRKNMEIYIAAVDAAKADNNWNKHPNPKRKGQDISLVKNLENFWLPKNEKDKKPKNLELKYGIIAAVIRLEIDKNKDILSDNDLTSSDDKYAYAVIVTNNTKMTANEIIRKYESRPEIEEDFRQLKDFWGLNTYFSTDYTVITFIIMCTLLGYNFYQLYKSTSDGEKYISKNFIVEQKHGLYVVKGVRTAIIVDDLFAIFEQWELLDLYVKLNENKRKIIKELLTF